MNDLKRTICNKVVFNKLNRDAILKTINEILNNAKINDNISDIIELYINSDTISYNALYDRFVESVNKYYGQKFSKKECAKYLILLELKSIVQKKKSYYTGLSEIENILRYFNRSYENHSKNTYGKMIDKHLSELMHDFDIEESYQYSKYDNEELAIKNINKVYENSAIDQALIEIIDNLEE